MLYFAEVFSGLVAKSSKFYQEHPAIQTARAPIAVYIFGRKPPTGARPESERRFSSFFVTSPPVC
jgi:hypothetical protein